MQQNTEDWLAWRNKGIGSSDVPVILGVSKYMTRFQLWEIKTGRVIPDNKSNFIQELGHRFEPMARADFEIIYNITMEPICVEHKDHDFLRASLDGYNEEMNSFQEIKFIGQDRFDWVKENQKPLLDHEPQTDHQFIITNANIGYYTCYLLDKSKAFMTDIVHVEIYPDPIRIEKEILPAIFEFWKCVKSDTPPDLMPKDIKRIKKQQKEKL